MPRKLFAFVLVAAGLSSLVLAADPPWLAQPDRHGRE